MVTDDETQPEIKAIDGETGATLVLAAPVALLEPGAEAGSWSGPSWKDTGSLIAANVAARGVPARVLGGVGRDPLGDLYRQWLKAHGVERFALFRDDSRVTALRLAGPAGVTWDGVAGSAAVALDPVTVSDQALAGVRRVVIMASAAAGSASNRQAALLAARLGVGRRAAVWLALDELITPEARSKGGEWLRAVAEQAERLVALPGWSGPAALGGREATGLTEQALVEEILSDAARTSGVMRP